jgi:ABC-type transport system involved in cytochrome bd biosynthesis fused ATPase/permease subunit
VTAVAIAALVLVFWSQPTWQIALAIAIVLLLVLVLIELIARSPAEPRPAGQHSGH